MNQETDDKIIQEQEKLFEQKMKMNQKKNPKVKKTGQQFDSANYELSKQTRREK